MKTAKSDDQRLMDACLRHARRHRGLTRTNPSVGTLLVKMQGQKPVIVGRGITALGGRPHAEPIALEQARDSAVHATAYVSLEPCAHHGATPPCAQALIDAGVSRVVTAWTDPDNRVDGRGHAMLRDAGIAVETGLGAETAAADLAGYLNRKEKNRPQVILKLAVSADGLLGREGEEVPITDGQARAYVHRMRAEADGILVGRGTVESDDPELTCRLSGLEHRSPHRFVLDTNASLPINSRLARSARQTPVSLITSQTSLPPDLEAAGVQHLIAETHDGQLALPEVLEDIASMGLSILMVEGGASVARAFLGAGLVDELVIFSGQSTLGKGIASPVTAESVPDVFSLVRTLFLGHDKLDIFRRK